MKKLLFLFGLTCSMAFSQNSNDSVMLKKISDEIMLNGEAYENLKDLTKNIGHRLSGSENYERAVVWAENQLVQAGADKVWLQEVMVPVWERGEESLKMKTSNGEWKDLRFLSLGNSEGTAGKDVEGELLRVSSIDEFKALPANAVKDKVVFFDYHFPQTFVNTFQGYGEAFVYRAHTASLVAEKGGKFVIIRSISTGLDDVPHTGTMRYDERFPKIPAVAIGNTTADELSQLLQNEKLTLKLNSNCGMRGEKLTHSVIGEITGRKDDKIILVGGHLDSWDVGEGAHDDGAGITQSIEIIRAFKQLGIQNNHTIRVVCFANEENGARGGEVYAKQAKENGEIHLLAIESDAGGFSPRGFTLKMDQRKINQVKSWTSLFQPYGVYEFYEGRGGGVDIDPLNREMNTPVAGMIPDSQRYFDLHHSANDTFEKINKRELNLGAIIMAQFMYLVDQYW